MLNKSRPSKAFGLMQKRCNNRAQNKPSNRIENFLDVSDSKARFKIIDQASFSDVSLFLEPEKIFSQVVIFTEDLSRLYEIASLVRFNYRLDYEILSLTSNFDQKIDQNEISLHRIKAH